MRDGRRKRLGLQEGTEGTVGDTYLDRILTDEEAAANPYTIAADTDVNFDTRDFRNISDTYNYYYGGGFDTAQDDATPPSSGDGGSGDGGTGGGATLPGFDDPTPEPINTPEQQRLIDEGIGVQLEPGSPVSSPYEGMPPTQEEINEFNQIPVNTDYRNQQLVNQGIGLRVGDRGPVFAPGEEPVTQAEIDAFNQTPQDYSVTGALGVDPLEKQDFVTQEDVDNPKGLLAKLGISPDFDIKKALIETGVNLIAGVPITLIAKALEAVLPDRDPRQNALDEFYTTGAGAQYMDPSSPNYIPGMENYNTVSGGGLYTLSGGQKGEEPTYGLQEAYQDRIDTIENTLADKYKMTATEIADVKAGSYTGDVNSDLLNRLNLLEEAKEKEKGRLDLFSGDIQESGDASIAERIYEADRLGISGDIGVEGLDDETDRFGGGTDRDSLSITSTTPQSDFTVPDSTYDEAGVFSPFAQEAPEEYVSTFLPETDIYNQQNTIYQKKPEEVETDIFAGVEQDTGGDSPAPSAPQKATETASYSNENEYESAAYDEPKSAPYQDAISRGQTGGGNDRSNGGGGGCCFIMLESRYGDGTMDKVVRRYRDEKMTPRNRRGYYKMARVLVPLMRKSKVFKWIVAKTFADPLVSYGKWYYGENKHGWIFAPVKTAWLKIFDVVGTDTVFIRENGEEV